MGMFDWVNFEMDCPVCGERVTGFQSKSAGCDLALLDPNEVANMYSSCGECDAWIALSREAPEGPKPRRKPFTLDEAKAMGFEVAVEEFDD